MGVNGGALQLYTVCKKPYLFTTIHMRIHSSYVLQVTCTASEHTMRFIRKNHYHHGTKLYQKNITRLLLLALLLMLHTRNNTDSNTLMLFSGIAW